MKFIDNENIYDPHINLAIEEYALKNLPIDESYLLFYVNEPSIIIGKNQNTHEEINEKYVEENNIHVVRRLSGGGAVYQDLGNLSFSFLTKDDGNSFFNYQKFTQPVVDALHKMKVEAKLSGRNDIQVGEKKISGNAQYTTRGKMFSHGTLLVDCNLENIVDALNVNQEKIKSKGIKSIRSRVANINDFLETYISVDELKKILLDEIFASNEIETYHLTDKDWEGINKIAEERYKNWDWNYGKNPKFDIIQSKRFEIGTIDVRLNVSKGKIKECKIFGDFFGVENVSNLEERLMGVKYDRLSLESVIENIELSNYFGKITQEEFITLLY